MGDDVTRDLTGIAHKWAPTSEMPWMTALLTGELAVRLNRRARRAHSPRYTIVRSDRAYPCSLI